MPRIYFFLILIITWNKCFTQNNIAITSIIDTIEKHHIGYKYFFSRNKAYNRFKQNIIKKTGKKLNVQASFILSEYLDTYKDNHIFYYISDSSIRHYKNFVSNRLNNDLIGLWKDLYSEVEYQIVKKENGDLCFVQIAGNDSMKIIRYDETGFATVLEFRKKFYITGFQLRKGIIYRNGKPFLKRINSISSSYKRQTRVFAGFIQKKLNDSVYLLRIGNLRRNYINTYDSIIKSIHRELSKSKVIIIDLRDCPGGIVTVLEPLFKYAYDGNPISYVEGFTSPTKESIVIRKAKFELIKSSLSNEDSLSYIKSINNDAKYVDKVYSDKRTPLLFNKKFDSVQKVFILQNRQTQSSGELFILAIKNSKKVITIGQNTRGVVDYGDGKLIEWGGFGINLSPSMCDYMTKYSLETVGIPPDIKFNNINDLDATIDYLIKRFK